MLGIVQRRVKEEHDLRNDPQLLANHMAKLSPVKLEVLVENLHHFFSLGGRENADISLGDREIGADAHLADRDHGTAEACHALAAENLSHILLDLTSDLELSCTRSLVHLLHVDDIIILLAPLSENVLAVDDVRLGDLIVHISHLVLVDAHAIALYHLAGLAL